jgi:hypothetical protein
VAITWIIFTPVGLKKCGSPHRKVAKETQRKTKVKYVLGELPVLFKFDRNGNDFHHANSDAAHCYVVIVDWPPINPLISQIVASLFFAFPLHLCGESVS